MKQQITNNDFHDDFKSMGREDQFTYEGKQALFDYLEQFEEDTGGEIELDVIALCCEYAEYKDLAEFQSAYNTEDYKTLDDIRAQTEVIIVNGGGFIIQSF